MTEQTPPGYLLGEMAATVRSIDQNVTAIRLEIGDLTKRLGHVETELASVQAEKAAMLPEYQAFVKTMRQHVIDTESWKNRFDGGTTVAKSGGRLLHGILASLFTLALFIAGQMWMDHRVNAERAEQVQH
jgi:uncharacterized protein YhdP